MMRFMSVVVLLAALRVAPAAEFTVKTADKAPPKEIGDSIRGALQSKAIQLLQGDKLAAEIWLRSELSLKSKPASAREALGSIAEFALLGAVSVEGAGLRDYKDNEVPKGFFTARFILQPKDGDHLGTAEFDYFIALIGVADDKELTGLAGFKPTVRASGKLTSSGHPLIISLRPATSDAPAPSLTTPAEEHKAIRMKLPGKTGGEKADVAFDLVIEGHGHIQ